jgi:hypothetical protein
MRHLRGLAVLALKTEADVYIAFDQKIDEYKHKTVLDVPISFTKTDDFEKDVEKFYVRISRIYFGRVYKAVS